MTGDLIAGVEAGGTKFVCGVGWGPTKIICTHTVATRSPEETLSEVRTFYKAAQARFGPIKSLGVASFGPLDLNPASTSFGRLLDTPKPGWSGFDLRGVLSRDLGCPVEIDTDVTGSGLAEAAQGAGRDLASIAYVTVGTGIGGALIAGGCRQHRTHHPEMGHLKVRRHAQDGAFGGVCPFHGDCLEGLASGPSITARYGAHLSALPQASPVHAILADYLAQLCTSIALIGSPERIILGGGVMSNPSLYPLIHREFHGQNNGYLDRFSKIEDVERFITPPALGDHAGLIGALMLAESANANPGGGPPWP